MPRIEDVFQSVGSSTFMTTLNLASGYWQIPLAHSFREKTAFATPFGLFQFIVMPFGLQNAPSSYLPTDNESPAPGLPRFRTGLH